MFDSEIHNNAVMTGIIAVFLCQKVRTIYVF